MAEENGHATERRRISAEDKGRILAEILLGGKSVSAAADEYRVHPNQIFAWRKELFESAADVFARKRPDIAEKARKRKIDELERALAGKDAVIAEIAQENLSLKKKIEWPYLGERILSLAERTAVVDEVRAMRARTGLAVSSLLSFLGIPRSTWVEWCARSGVETRRVREVPGPCRITPEESRAVLDFCRKNADGMRGYRYLAHRMSDENIAQVRPSSVYNIMRRAGLFARRSSSSPKQAGRGFEPPSRPNEQWHTDFSYVRVRGTFLYFASILDGYSRRILAWDLFPTMEGLNAEILVVRAKELHPATPAPESSTTTGNSSRPGSSSG